MKSVKYFVWVVLISILCCAVVNDGALAYSFALTSDEKTGVDQPVEALPLPDSTLVCPASIEFGQTVQCSITVVGTKVSLTFGANAGDRVRIRMLDTSGTAFYPRWWLYRPDGTDVCNSVGELGRASGSERM